MRLNYQNIGSDKIFFGKIRGKEEVNMNAYKYHSVVKTERLICPDCHCLKAKIEVIILPEKNLLK